MDNVNNKKYTRLKGIVVTHLSGAKGSLVLASLCMIGFTTSQLLAPWPLKLIVDYILLEESLPIFLSSLQTFILEEKGGSVIVLSLSILMIALMDGMFSYWQIFITSRIGFRLVYTLRKELYSHIQRLSLSFHDRNRSGEIITKITGDTKALKNIFSESVLTLSAHTLTILGMFFVMFMISWKLALIVLSTFPFLAYSLFFLYRKINQSSKKQRKNEGKVASRVSELLPMISLVQSFSREQHEEALFEADSLQTLEESIRVARMVAETSRTVEILKACGTASAILFGSFQVLKGNMTPGDVFIFAAYMKNMYSPVQKVARLSVKFSKAMASAQRISVLLETEPEILDRPQATKARHLKGEISFNHVSFGYDPDHPVFNRISFSVLPGQRVALVGSSGAGKSSIAKLILRLYDIQEGEILIDGIDIRDYQRASLRHEIGVVVQDSILFGTTIRENISYGKPDATQEEIEESARQAYAHDFITALPDGYETTLGERGSTLSGGQRQRIGLARAIIKRPPILILDEPTSAVDAESAQLIHKSMDRFQKGKTSLVIIHQFKSIEEYDQIIVLKKGEVVEQGSHQTLIDQNGYYQELYHHQKL